MKDREKTIGVVGAGTMGNGIAHVFALNNYKVVLVDMNTNILEDALNNIKSKHRSFLRSILRYTTHVKFDRQGRVQIPDVLLDYAEIKKDVEIIGFGTKLEIWNPKKLEEMDEQSFDGEDFEDLANDISF